MECPWCGGGTRVVETRAAEEGRALRRRRQCSACERRFTTYERHEQTVLHVRKRDGSRQRFDPEKLRDALRRAAHKRPVSAEQVGAIVARIEAETDRAGGELSAQRVGELCLAGLRELDWGAYLQFAAVYRELADPEAVRAELERLRAVESQEKDRAVSGPGPGTDSIRPDSDHQQFTAKVG